MKRKLIELEMDVLIVIDKLNQRGNKCLVVGGAVRDAILGIEPKDIDIEVYNTNYNDLMEFLSQYGKVDLVGKKFGTIVFNPYRAAWTSDAMKYDFSIPRKENKIGVGHKDFEIIFDTKMTIPMAAMRRDATFNALAYDPLTHEVFDFFGGVNDLENKIIRHTSSQFSEDSLRILRFFQFQSRFDFELHHDTIIEIKNMLNNTQDFSMLPKERLYEEWRKWAEKGINHSRIFKFMRDTDLINEYPLLKLLKETPQDDIFHPEGDVERHSELCLKRIDEVIKENDITGVEKIILVMSVLLHDIAKPTCTEEKMKRGRMTITSEGHEEMGGVIAKEFMESIGFPESIITPVCNIIANHLAGVNISMITALSGKTKAVKKLSRKLHPATIQQLLFVMDADTNGRNFGEYREPTGAKDIQEIASQVTIVNKQYEYILMGRHLLEAGLSPSPMFKTILDKANESQVEGVFTDLSVAKEWLSSYLNNVTA